MSDFSVLFEIAKVLYGMPLCYLSCQEKKIVDILVEADFVKIEDGHVRTI